MPWYSANVRVAIDFIVEFEAEDESAADIVADKAAHEIASTIDTPGAANAGSVTADVSYDGIYSVTVEDGPFEEDE